MNDKPTLYLCSCSCGAVAVSKLDWGDDDQFVCLSLWRHGIDTFGWRSRLRHIWHIIKYGHPYTDTVLLKPERAHRLGGKLQEMAGEMVTARVKRLKRKPVASCG